MDEAQQIEVHVERLFTPHFSDSNVGAARIEPLIARDTVLTCSLGYTADFRSASPRRAPQYGRTDWRWPVRHLVACSKTAG